MALYDYRWATGHNVALANLINVEDDLWPYTRPRIAAPRSAFVDTFPVVNTTLSQKTYGDGAPIATWTFDALPIEALDYIIDTYLVTASVEQKSKEITIYTRRAERQTYTRYNAYLVLPQPGVNYTYRQGRAVDLVLTFNITEAL